MTKLTPTKLFLWALVGFVLVFAAFTYSSVQSVSKLSEFTLGDDPEYFEGSGNVAILNIEGVIMSAEESLEKIREIEDNSDIKGLVVRIDSPGGAVGPSQEIYDALMELRRKKIRVVCSLGDIAASGGYYIASACEKIISNPGTLTGSIGVIMHFMNLKDLYTWAKVQPVTIKAGHFKDIGSESRAMTDEERELLQELLDGVHRQFKKAVQEGRALLDAKSIEKYADGRIFTGEKALELGFVDQLGGEQTALNVLETMLDAGKIKVIRERKHRRGLRALFDTESLFEGGLQKLLGLAVHSGLGSQFVMTPGVPYLLPEHMYGTSVSR